MKRIILMAALAGCTGSANYWVHYQPTRGTTSQPKATVVQRAIVAITDVGREVETSDAASGIVISKWFSGDGFGQDTNRFRVRVTVQDDGAYEVVASCQAKDTGPMSDGGWKDNCEPTKRPAFVADVMRKIDTAMK